MSNLAVGKLRELTKLPVQEVVYELLEGDYSGYRAFCREVGKAGTYAKELKVMQSMIIRMALGQELPPKKFKQLKRGKKDGVTDYEMVTANLRLYFFKHPVSGKVVVCGGGANKTQQPQDIERMRLLKKEFYKNHLASS